MWWAGGSGPPRGPRGTGDGSVSVSESVRGGHTLVSCFAVPVVKPAVLPGTKALSTVSAQAAAAQKNKLKEPGGGSFR